MLRFVCLQQFPVDRNGVIDGRGKRILWREAVIDGNDLGPGQVGNRNPFHEGSGIGVEPPAMDVNQHAIALAFRNRQG